MLVQNPYCGKDPSCEPAQCWSGESCMHCTTDGCNVPAVLPHQLTMRSSHSSTHVSRLGGAPTSTPAQQSTNNSPGTMLMLCSKRGIKSANAHSGAVTSVKHMCGWRWYATRSMYCRLENAAAADGRQCTSSSCTAGWGEAGWCVSVGCH